VLLAISDWQR